MKAFLEELLATIGNVAVLLATIFVLVGVPIVFFLEPRQCMSNIEVGLDFIMVSLWGAWFPDYLKNIGKYSTSLYKRLKGESNE